MRINLSFDTYVEMRKYFQDVFGVPIAVFERLDTLLTNQEQQMATEQDLQNDLDTIKAGVTAVVQKLDAQANQIQDLKAQVAAGSQVTQVQLDGLHTEAKSIADQLRPVVDAPPAASGGSLGSQPLADR